MDETIILQAKCTCSQCKFEWVPRVATPRKCPSCQSRNWQGSEKGQEA